MKVLSEPALFWLDGHYSGGGTARGATDTPVVEELTAVLGSRERRHAVVVDDARCFGSDPAYPSVEEMLALVRSKRRDVDVEVDPDMLRISPRKVVG